MIDHRTWTAGEEQVIIDHPDWSTTQVAQELKRTVDAVKVRRSLLRRQARLGPAGVDRIRHWLATPENQGGPDKLARPILQWMVAERLTFEHAARVLHVYPEMLIRVTAFRQRYGAAPRGVQERTLRDLARRLGSIRAQAWDEETWTEALLRAQRPDRHARTWVADSVESIDTADPLVCALRERIIWIRDSMHPLLSREQVGSIAHVSARVAADWLGRSGRVRKGPVRPSLHRVANVARLLAYPEADVSAIETAMRRVFDLLADARDRGLIGPGKKNDWTRWRHVSDAGLLILCELSELAKSASWLSKAADLDGSTVIRYIRDGIATARTQQRVADALKLDAEKRGLLSDRTSAPPWRDERERTKKIRITWVKKRGRARFEEHAEGGRKRGRQAVQLRAWEKLDAACQLLIDCGKVRPNGTLSRYALKDRTGCKVDVILTWWDQHGQARYGHLCRVS